MASTSVTLAGGVTSRIRSTASTLHSDSQSLFADLRRALKVMKDVAVDLETDNQSEMVKQLEDGVTELLESYEDYSHFLSAIQSVGEKYQPEEELTDFKKLFEDEMSKIKASSSLPSPQNNNLMRQFKEAIWRVHHAGQPMPGEEEEDIVMTSTQCNLLNTTCPLTGKPVFELSDPVRSVACKHVYEKKAITIYIRSKKNTRNQCPVAGCPKTLQEANLMCDPFLLVEIEELRKMSKQTDETNVIEDFTSLDEVQEDE